jgi:glycerophosphoryl diester phosphodiesterase
MTSVHPYLAGPLPRAFAHRGWHLDELADRENSLSAFQRAAAEGYQYLETDVHATSDEVVVVHHDPLLDRTTDGHGAIADHSWAEVRTMKIAGREPLVSLEEVLEELPEARFNVDVKTDDAVIPFLRVVERAQAFDRVAAAAFSDARLARLRRLAGPKLMTSLGPRSAALLWLSRRFPLLGSNFLIRGHMAQVPVRQTGLTIVDSLFLLRAATLAIEVHTWTVDSGKEMQKLLDLGVQGIVTDRPDLLKEVLVSRGAWVMA